MPNTEYILMAKAKGTELGKIYIEMPIEKKKVPTTYLLLRHAQ